MYIKPHTNPAHIETALYDSWRHRPWNLIFDSNDPSVPERSDRFTHRVPRRRSRDSGTDASQAKAVFTAGGAERQRGRLCSVSVPQRMRPVPLKRSEWNFIHFRSRVKVGIKERGGGHERTSAKGGHATVRAHSLICRKPLNDTVYIICGSICCGLFCIEWLCVSQMQNTNKEFFLLRFSTF